ncbi:MAG TPA: YqiA/YcfP family alpha/beta fold hydrolase, partial [Thermoanaerobaculia bacterium]|nr:YqiA/YcfP family alpha/beta fold hydrolase [Thermoanaerobaculia bacterium]
MTKVLYLHGFASSPAGRKIGALTELLRPHGIAVVAPDLNVPSFRELDFDAMASLTLAQAERHAPSVVVGSSLGAVVALGAIRLGARVPLVLVAPAIGFGRRWTEKLPPGDPLFFFHHAEGRELPIHRRFFEDLADRRTEAE